MFRGGFSVGVIASVLFPSPSITFISTNPLPLLMIALLDVHGPLDYPRASDSALHMRSFDPARIPGMHIIPQKGESRDVVGVDWSVVEGRRD